MPGRPVGFYLLPISTTNQKKKLLCDLCVLVCLSQELFFITSREAGKKIFFKIALVTENVTLSNPGV